VIVIASQLAFWCGLTLAAQHYPSEYDWRYMTISSLLYPDRDPAGHGFAQTGVVLAGLMGLAWALTLAGRRARGTARQGPSSGPWILAFGYACMAVAAAVPLGLGHIRKSHEVLSVAAFLALCIGLAQLAMTMPSRRLLAGIAFAPVTLAAISQAYVHWALPHLPWVSLAWRARSIPAYLSFAFWQWIACAVFSLLALGLEAQEQTLILRCKSLITHE
jgi:hypothetical protein